MQEELLEIAAKYKIREEEVMYRRDDNGSSIFLMRCSDFKRFKISGVAAEVWQQLTEGKDIESIIDECTDMYDVDRAVIAMDVKLFINELNSLNLVEPC